MPPARTQKASTRRSRGMDIRFDDGYMETMLEEKNSNLIGSELENVRNCRASQGDTVTIPTHRKHWSQKQG